MTVDNMSPHLHMRPQFGSQTANFARSGPSPWSCWGWGRLCALLGVWDDVADGASRCDCVPTMVVSIRRPDRYCTVLYCQFIKRTRMRRPSRGGAVMPYVYAQSTELSRTRSERVAQSFTRTTLSRSRAIGTSVSAKSVKTSVRSLCALWPLALLSTAVPVAATAHPQSSLL